MGTAFRTGPVHFNCGITAGITVAQVKVDTFIKTDLHCPVYKGSYCFLIVVERITDILDLAPVEKVPEAFFLILFLYR